MLGFLEDIWHAVESVPYYVVGWFVEAINGAIIGLAAFASFAVGLLPSFPSFPEAPAGGILGGLIWFVPIPAMVSWFVTFTALWVSFLGVKVALKWVRAL